ncbi:hypothetical protein H4219_003890 [Mycoemilia scoparia]|uniref:Metallo-beta-lactamase domain-containing protein n=1 Tax=Mycoemilia scoparia TaxID=417184 RepID=A0A9W7ZZ78_9FUNG|nr:hypothetical protein H4219_003890 [Mycoemilia scoparia]
MTQTLVTPKVRDIIFLGTGTSGCIPNIPCITSRRDCKVCWSTLKPEGQKNRRRNTSLLVRFEDSSGRIRNVIIDCGKTFYESAVECFIKYDVPTIDAVLLTHGHADAILGLDDLRQWTMSLGIKIPIFLNSETYECVARAFPYLIDIKKATGGGEVPALSFHELKDPSVPINIHGLEFLPLKVEHGSLSNGDPYYFWGFRFDDIVYISDCSYISEETRQLMKNSNVLVIDALNWKYHPSHYGVPAAMRETRELKPKLTIFTDMCHSIDHYELEKYLADVKKDEGLNIIAAYDGLKIDIQDKID